MRLPPPRLLPSPALSARASHYHSADSGTYLSHIAPAAFLTPRPAAAHTHPFAHRCLPCLRTFLSLPQPALPATPSATALRHLEHTAPLTPACLGRVSLRTAFCARLGSPCTPPHLSHLGAASSCLCVCRFSHVVMDLSSHTASNAHTVGFHVTYTPLRACHLVFPPEPPGLPLSTTATWNLLEHRWGLPTFIPVCLTAGFPAYVFTLPATHTTHLCLPAGWNFLPRSLEQEHITNSLCLPPQVSSRSLGTHLQGCLDFLHRSPTTLYLLPQIDRQGITLQGIVSWVGMHTHGSRFQTCPPATSFVSFVCVLFHSSPLQIYTAGLTTTAHPRVSGTSFSLYAAMRIITPLSHTPRFNFSLLSASPPPNPHRLGSPGLFSRLSTTLGIPP